MFRFTSREPAENITQKNSDDCLIRSLINDAHLISEHAWAISLVRKKNTEHAFLIMEGKKGEEYTILRSDMFLDMTGKPFDQPYNKTSSAINFVWEKSQHINGCGFIRINELTIQQLDKLVKVSEFQSWGLSLADAEKILSRLLIEHTKTYPYNFSGDTIGSASTSRSNTQNCVTWCQKILREELGVQVGDSWSIIKKPSEVVKKAILQNNPALNYSRHQGVL